MIQRVLFCLLIVPFTLGCGGDGGQSEQAAHRIDPPPISRDLQDQLESWLSENGDDPANYVTGLFETHDVVLLGEQHYIRHDVVFVQELLPRLYAAGVHALATEWARRVDQGMLDSLMALPEWDESLGREIVFRQFVPWGFREYVDVLKAAWRVNRNRSPGEPPFRVLAVNHDYDYSHIQTEADQDDPVVWERIRRGQTEAEWAGPVIAAVGNGQKVLAHCGINHAFTGFRQPRVRDGRFLEWNIERFGNALRKALGPRAVTVFLHAPWNGPAGYNIDFVHPADGRLDAFMLNRPGGPFAVGFDVADSPLADLPIENAVYKHGYEPFTMAKFCDGWIYTRPIGEYETVDYIEGWINDENLEAARANSMNPRMRDDTVEEFNEGLRSYRRDFKRFYGHLR